jgi:hypothetical protein
MPLKQQQKEMSERNAPLISCAAPKFMNIGEIIAYKNLGLHRYCLIMWHLRSHTHPGVKDFTVLKMFV